MNRSKVLEAAQSLALVELMSELARDGTVATPVVSGCALTLSTHGLEAEAEDTVAIRGASDAFALAMESIQDQIGEGPSMAARRAGVAVSATDIQAELVGGAECGPGIRVS